MQLKNKKYNELEYRTTNQVLHLRRCIASSGEGDVWKTDRQYTYAKIYHRLDAARSEKLAYMIAHPPEDPTLKDGHVSIAWPKDLIYDAEGVCCGFTMPEIHNGLPLNNIYNPKLRKKNAPNFNWYYLHVAALNVSWIMHSLHSKNYVVGDIKPENFLVSNRALVSVIDVDSFQITNLLRSNVHEMSVFRCGVGSEGFTPPELIGKDLATVDRTPIHDRFGLAVLVHLLLLGHHPFSGTWEQGEEMPSQDELIRSGYWPHAKKAVGVISPSPLSIPMEVLPPSVQEGFQFAFEEGHTDPEARPSASQWVSILEEAIDHLVLCEREDGHFFSDTNDACYWCERKEKYNTDIFPTPLGTTTQQFLIIKRFERAVKSKSYRNIVKLWNENAFLRTHPLFTKKKQQVEEIKKKLSALDEFKNSCRKYFDDEEALWNLWRSMPELSEFELTYQEPLGETTIAEYMAIVEKRLYAVKEIQKVLKDAERLDKKGAVRESTESKLCTMMEKYEEVLKSSTILRRMGLSKRVHEARQRLKKWQELQKAIEDKSDHRILAIWHSNPLLQNFEPAQDIYAHVKAAERREKILAEFVSYACEHPHDDTGILNIWARDPSLKNSVIATLPHERLGNISPIDRVGEAQRRRQIIARLKELTTKVPVDFMAIADVWETRLCHDHPDFQTFLPLISWTFQKSGQFRDLLLEIKKPNFTKIREMWDEENFNHPIRNMGLQSVVVEAFKKKKGSPYKKLAFGSLKQDKKYLKVKWEWPEDGAPIAIVAVDSKQYPADFYAVNKSSYYRVVSRKEYCSLGHVALEYRGPNAYVSIWPGNIVCGEPIICGEPLHLKQIVPEKISYKVQLVEEGKIKISIKALKPLFLPPMQLKISSGRPPVLEDSSENLIQVVDLPALDLIQGLTMSVDLAVPALAEKMRESIDRVYVKLFPVDQRVLQEIEFECTGEFFLTKENKR